jgi:DNA repair protein RecN (Recombination protein N)
VYNNSIEHKFVFIGGIMITNLHIKNIGIIDEINLNLNEGFNVLTGETGAGKTLIIDSLQIIAGGRFSKEMIRHGETFSFVEMSLFLPNMGFEDDTVIISREMNLNGKNLCKINGRLATVSELKEFMNDIINIHGQNSNQTILDNSTHISLINDFAKEEIEKPLVEYRIHYDEYLRLKKELKENYGDDREKQRKLDLLKYEVEEIENANLKVGEDEEIEEKRKIIASSEKIVMSLQEAETQISDNVIENLNSAIRAMEKIENYKEEYSTLVGELKSAYYELQEAARDISTNKEDIYFDEEEQKEIEDRYDLIHSLKRKYGNTIEEILKYKEEKEAEIEQIENLDEYILKLKKQKKAEVNEMKKLATELHEIREKYSNILSNAINKELQDLEMKNAKFSVQNIMDEENSFNKNGLDKLEFLIQTNVGEEAKPLVKIASGGEMSRIMLAIKNVLANVDKVPVLIFDEIDTGISGKAANATGEKMKSISKMHQVICVTHQASIAAKGDYNYYICKEVNNGKTSTKIRTLSEAETINEIARIASGEINEASLNHAKELRHRGLKLVG